jgi:molybdopterin-guanine dinucleotide biosynthesis protein
MTIVVGGSGRKVGKTSLIESLIRAYPKAGWLAVKISGHPHGARAPELEREASPGPDTDTARFLAAGAREAWWLRTEPAALPEALPQLLSLTGRFENVLIESNSIVELLDPDLYVFVAGGETKESAGRWKSRADIVVPGVAASVPPEIARLIERKIVSLEK